MKIFSIFDCKAEAYLQPFFSVNRAVAIRNFTVACKDESSQFHKHAADYTLFEIGEFDEQNAKITPYEAKQPLGCALEYLSLED